MFSRPPPPKAALGRQTSGEAAPFDNFKFFFGGK
jgi:hypothetical protein